MVVIFFSILFVLTRHAKLLRHEKVTASRARIDAFVTYPPDAFRTAAHFAPIPAVKKNTLEKNVLTQPPQKAQLPGLALGSHQRSLLSLSVLGSEESLHHSNSQQPNEGVGQARRSRGLRFDQSVVTQIELDEHVVPENKLGYDHGGVNFLEKIEQHPFRVDAAPVHPERQD